MSIGPSCWDSNENAWLHAIALALAATSVLAAIVVFFARTQPAPSDESGLSNPRLSQSHS